MRIVLLLALVVLLGAACSDDPAPEATPPADLAWLTQRPENAHPYADETVAWFGNLVRGAGWRDAAWNVRGTLEAVHVKTGLTFVLIPAGEFLMGSPEAEKGREPDERQHRVTVPAFLLCKTECTQRAWDAVGGEDDRWWKGLDLPIQMVTWMSVSAWCRKAGLRLPSEAEWEYACRAGTETPAPTGTTLSTEQANSRFNESQKGGGPDSEQSPREACPRTIGVFTRYPGTSGSGVRTGTRSPTTSHPRMGLRTRAAARATASSAAATGPSRPCTSAWPIAARTRLASGTAASASAPQPRSRSRSPAPGSPRG